MSTFNSAALLTVAAAIFVAELTDKDAFLLLTLATRRRAWFVFAAGSTAFTITTAIITTSGYFLLRIAPVLWIKLAGGVVMISYGLWEFFKAGDEGKELESEKSRVLSSSAKKNMIAAFLSAVAMLALLDLAGDATEILTIIFIAQIQDVPLVFIGALAALIAATALETFLGGQLGKILSSRRLRIFSVIVFLSIGTATIITTVL
jgi:putative Ca2+/H+ antiporter (TMEM165/GDT1 family)